MHPLIGGISWLIGVVIVASKFATRLDAPFGVLFVPATPLSLSTGSWALAFHIHPYVNMSHFEEIGKLLQQTETGISRADHSQREILTTRLRVLELTVGSIKQSTITVRLATEGGNPKRDKKED